LPVQKAYTIEPHNEYMVAAANRPRKLFLVCSEEPTHGGKTTQITMLLVARLLIVPCLEFLWALWFVCGSGEWVITDASKLHHALPPSVLNKFAELGTR
jgi:hypothetical protein